MDFVSNKVDSLSRVACQHVANYDSTLQLWETAFRLPSNTEMKARIQGVESQMQPFKFLSVLILSEMITDKLSQTLQQPKLSSVEGHQVARLTVNVLEGL